MDLTPQLKINARLSINKLKQGLDQHSQTLEGG
jgi:hypothetical protein